MNAERTDQQGRAAAANWWRQLDGRLLTPADHARNFHDGHRAVRALLVGTLISLAMLHRLPLDEAVSVGFLVAMLTDLALIARSAKRLTPRGTRHVFGHWRVNRRRLMERTVLLAFMSIGLMSLCVYDVHRSASTLPSPVRILIYFAALFATWLQLHMGFAGYYARHYFILNPIPAADGPNPQGFVFTGSDEPTLTDFMYVAFAVGLTYAMSDVNLEDAHMRRVVLVHAVVSFLFYSTVISAVLNLLTST